MEKEKTVRPCIKNLRFSDITGRPDVGSNLKRTGSLTGLKPERKPAMTTYTTSMRRSMGGISFEDDDFIEEIIEVGKQFRPFSDAMDAGLDLSSTSDLTAMVLVFPPRDEDEATRDAPGSASRVRCSVRITLCGVMTVCAAALTLVGTMPAGERPGRSS